MELTRSKFVKVFTRLRRESGGGMRASPNQGSLTASVALTPQAQNLAALRQFTQKRNKRGNLAVCHDQT